MTATLSPSTPRPSKAITVEKKTTFKYVIGELLGKGTYGRVYLSLNVNTGQLMAVKQVELPASGRTDSRQMEVVEALKFESKTLKDLEHPNIVQYLGYEETSHHMNIFLEYIPGGTIGSCVLKHGRFDEDVTKWFTVQILAGLEYLHSTGILHRDLKGDNILVETSGVCKISDFGISKKEDGKGQHTQLKGTVYWMAPEVVAPSKRGYDSKVDIWSLGCVVLEMWSGQRPWDGFEVITVMLKLHKDKQPPPLPADLKLPDLALDFRQKCFAMDPETRPSANILRQHPYLELTPGWSFQLSDIEKPPLRASSSRRKGKNNSRHRNSSAPAPRHRHTTTDVPPVPTNPRNGWPTVRPASHLVPSMDTSGLRSNPTESRSPFRPPPGDPPPIVYITPLSSLDRVPSRNSISPPTSESTRTSASPRLRNRKSFYVVNPDPEPADDRAIRTPYVYSPPPLPAADTLRPSSSQQRQKPSKELQSRSPVAGSQAGQSRLAPAPSMPDLAGSLQALSSRQTTYGWEDSYSESDSDSNVGTLWQKPPIDLQKPPAPRHQEDKFARRRSIIETKQDMTWAPRPNLQEVYSNLQDFFPRVDLDKPIVGPSPEQSDRRRRTRSIRMVAEVNRNAQLRRTATTTKLWGHRVEEMESI
ncbi:kinase-like domain-containing protein [Mycena galericulata]|nr:kinase-like domain-containing protein [Mycena galericulata]